MRANLTTTEEVELGITRCPNMQMIILYHRPSNNTLTMWESNYCLRILSIIRKHIYDKINSKKNNSSTIILHHIPTQRFIISIIREKKNKAIAQDNLTIYSIALTCYICSWKWDRKYFFTSSHTCIWWN